MTTIEVDGHLEIQDGRQVLKWKNVTNGYLTHDTINSEKIRKIQLFILKENNHRMTNYHNTK